jgi:hypothetical protein
LLKAKRIQQAYSNYRKVRRALCKSIDRVADLTERSVRALTPSFGRTNKHHAAMKAIFGHNDETVEILEIYHRQFHAMLDAALRIKGLGFGNTSMATWATSGNRKEAAHMVLRMSQIFDKACAGSPGFNELTPTVKRVMSLTGLN